MNKQFQKASFARAIGRTFTMATVQPRIEPWVMLLAEDMVSDAVKAVDYSVHPSAGELKVLVLQLLKQAFLTEIEKQL